MIRRSNQGGITPDEERREDYHGGGSGCHGHHGEMIALCGCVVLCSYCIRFTEFYDYFLFEEIVLDDLAAVLGHG